MKSSRLALSVLMILVGCVIAAAQTDMDVKPFDKDGLSFSYPNGWALNDTSNADAQQLTVGRADSEAQITIFVYRPLLTTPEKIAEAKKVLVDKYIASTSSSFEQAGAHPQSSPVTSEIGGVASDGVKIRASLDGVPGAAEIHHAVVGQRLIVLTILGPDKAVVKAAPAWDMIRTSLKITGPQPKAQPSNTPKPQ